MLRSLAAVLGLLVLVACTPRPLPEARLFTNEGWTHSLLMWELEKDEVTDDHRRWWADVEDCIGLEGDVGQVLLMRAGAIQLGDGQWLSGLRSGRMIFLTPPNNDVEASLAPEVYERFMWQHEAIHWLRAWNGLDPDAEHRGEYWKRCLSLEREA